MSWLEQVSERMGVPESCPAPGKPVDGWVRAVGESVEWGDVEDSLDLRPRYSGGSLVTPMQPKPMPIRH